MKVKLKTQYAGPAGTFAPGAVADFPEEEAKALIAGGFAAPALAKASVETASTKPAENAAEAHQRRQAQTEASEKSAAQAKAQNEAQARAAAETKAKAEAGAKQKGDAKKKKK